MFRESEKVMRAREVFDKQDQTRAPIFMGDGVMVQKMDRVRLNKWAVKWSRRQFA